ncbi:MAG: DMT family transporter, partial [Rubrobacteraceae bacterium]
MAVVIAVMVGVTVAFQVSLTAAAQRSLGPAMMVAISGFATGFAGLAVALLWSKPEFSSRIVIYAAVSGILGAFILGGIAFAAGQAGVARAFSLVIGSQLIAALILDRIGLFGA